MTAIDEPLVMDALMDARTFGLRLRELRQAAGMSQAALSKSSGIPQGTLAKWELGNREALVSAIPKLAVALGVPVESLFADPASDVPRSKRGRPRKADEDDE